MTASLTLSSAPNPEAPLPPLPDAIPDPEPSFSMMPQTADASAAAMPGSFVGWPGWHIRSLRHGCYLMRFTPNTGIPFIHYDGTMRIQRDGSNTIASGDLYLHYAWQPFPTFPSVSEPNPANGIPIFPRSRHRYYLKVTKILEWITFGNSFTLGFERWRFNQSTNTWTFDDTYTAKMAWITAPAGYPSTSDYLTGDVKNTSGTVVGQLAMGWVSKYLRKATIEADLVKDSEYPADNGNGVDWRDVYEKVDWDVKVYDSDGDLAEPSGESWSDAELHASMLNHRDSANLDAEWRYHLLCVRRLDSTSRGIMYDAYGGDSNNIPREGAAIASHWVIPDTTMWGHVKGKRFGDAPAPYFRTAVHELGHAMGLYHNTADNGFMNTTGVIAANATPGTFPDNVLWTFTPDDAKRLRHMPDPWVRPGMIPFGQPYNAAPISPTDMILDAEGLQLSVSPLMETVPIGAPVRVDIELSNISEYPLPVPESLSLKAGHTKGKVIDPSGTVRTFWPLVRCIELTTIVSSAKEEKRKRAQRYSSQKSKNLEEGVSGMKAQSEEGQRIPNDQEAKSALPKKQGQSFPYPGIRACQRQGLSLRYTGRPEPPKPSETKLKSEGLGILKEEHGSDPDRLISKKNERRISCRSKSRRNYPTRLTQEERLHSGTSLKDEFISTLVA